MKTVDIITSALNEESCLPELFSRIQTVFKAEPNYNYRVLITDNGSSDATWEIIKAEAASTRNIIGFKMARTFSFEAALTNGLDNALGDVAIIMASDLQDPPEVIPQFLREFEKGFQQVTAKIVTREHVPFIRRTLSKLFYLIANKLTSGMLPESVSDFRLVSKDVYQSITRLREQHRFIRGFGAWVGFRTTCIEIKRPERFSGSSKWLNVPLRRVIAGAIKSILAYSAQPLSWISALGVIMSFSSVIGIIGLAFFWIIRGVPFAGFGTLVGLMFLGFSIMMLCIGILAQYLGLIYEEVKARPLYIVSEKTESAHKLN
jgi:polyisoprenyl-phosphate glycosyltransferase